MTPHIEFEVTEPSWTALLFPDLSDTRLRGSLTYEHAVELAGAVGGFVVPAPITPIIDINTASSEVLEAVTVDIDDPSEQWRRDALLAVRRTLHNQVKITRALLAGFDKVKETGDRSSMAEEASVSLQEQKNRAVNYTGDDEEGPDPLPDAFWLPTEDAWRSFGGGMREYAALLTGRREDLAMMGWSNGSYRRIKRQDSE